MKITKEVSVTAETDGIKCSEECQFLHFNGGYCQLFDEHLEYEEWIHMRCEKCLDAFQKGI